MEGLTGFKNIAYFWQKKMISGPLFIARRARLVSHIEIVSKVLFFCLVQIEFQWGRRFCNPSV
jgi:hypothetical protein